MSAHDLHVLTDMSQSQPEGQSEIPALDQRMYLNATVACVSILTCTQHYNPDSKLFKPQDSELTTYGTLCHAVLTPRSREYYHRFGHRDRLHAALPCHMVVPDKLSQRLEPVLCPLARE